MRSWALLILLVLSLGCQSVKKIAPSEAELNIPINFNNYIFNPDPSGPLQTVRISIHIFQDSTGAGNFKLTDENGDRAPEWYWVNGLVEDASKRMGDMAPMQMPSASKHIKDSRIRYKVVGTYAWQNQELFELSEVYPITGRKMYEYIMQQSAVTHRDNSLHLFFAGSSNLNKGKIASRGIASGAPDKKWTVLFNYYDLHIKDKANYWPATLISHEIGHNLGLAHTWNRNDGCDDTPH